MSRVTQEVNEVSGVINRGFEPCEDEGNGGRNEDQEKCKAQTTLEKSEAELSEVEPKVDKETCGKESLRKNTQLGASSNKMKIQPEEIRLRGITAKEMLTHLFNLFDYRDVGKINQDDWIQRLKSQIGSEPGGVEFIEVVQSVAYVLVEDDDLDLNNFCKIFEAKHVLPKLFRLIDQDLKGVITKEETMEFISRLSMSRPGNRLTSENIKWLEKLFRQHVKDGNEISREEFTKIIHTKNQFFTDRVFDIFDKDGSGTISLHEFLDAMHQFASQEPEDKIRFLFKVYDVDGDGGIQCDELSKVMRACMEENGMKFSEQQICDLTMALFEDADADNTGVLSYDELKAQLEKHEGLLQNLSISIDRWLVPPKPEKENQSFSRKLRSIIPHQFSIKYMTNNYLYLIWLSILIFVNVGLFVSRGVKYSKANPRSTLYLVLARAAGQCLNFNCTLIVVVMLRNCLTFLRAHGAAAFIPIDHHIYFHKMTGWFIFIFSFTHTIMHLLNIKFGIMPNDRREYWEHLLMPIHSLGLIEGYAFNSGVLLVVILTIMVLCSLPFVRRGGSFEIFYWTHLLYFAFWTLLIIHAPNFWKWFVVPGCIFLVEQAYRVYRWKMGKGRTSVSSGILLPSKVTHLVIRKPPNFDYHPGDYIYVRIPKIAKYEWHPFTISSAPEQEDAIWIHVRAVGQWTKRLYDYFEREQKRISKLSQNSYDKSKSPCRFSLKRLSQRKYNLTPDINLGEFKVCSESKKPNETPLKVRSDSQESNLSKELEAQNCDKPVLSSAISLPLSVRPNYLAAYKPLNWAQRNIPQFNRSMSTNSVDKSKHDSNLYYTGSGAIIKTPATFRYMGQKPIVIPLKSPSFETKQLSSNNDLSDSIAERGMSEKLLEPKDELGTCESESNDESKEFKTFGSANGKYPALESPSPSHESVLIGKPLEIYIDGPYGAPSSHIFRAEHAVLIGAGIGVTPFASILQSIMHRYWVTRNKCPKCEYTWCADLPKSVLNLKKVDFFWINRDQRSFEWFVHLLSQLEIEQAELGGAMERFLDMHMYITSALQKTDMKAVGLQLALDLLHEKEKRDLITGLKTRTNAGRPNWNKVFNQLMRQYKGKITVFYCGPAGLARTLKIKCDEFGFSFRKELF